MWLRQRCGGCIPPSYLDSDEEKAWEKKTEEGDHTEMKRKTTQMLLCFLLGAVAGMAFAQSQTGVVYKTTDNIVVDGILNESCWQDKDNWHVNLNGQADPVIPHPVPPPWPDSMDLSAKGYVVWDGEALYVAMSRTDNVNHATDQGLATCWEDDNMELWLTRTTGIGETKVNNTIRGCLLALPQCKSPSESPANGIVYLGLTDTSCAYMPKTKTVQASWPRPKLGPIALQNDTLIFTILYHANCCPNFKDSLRIEDRLIHIIMCENDKCYCVCPFETQFTFAGIVPGEHRIVFQTIPWYCDADTANGESFCKLDTTFNLE